MRVAVHDKSLYREYPDLPRLGGERNLTRSGALHQSNWMQADELSGILQSQRRDRAHGFADFFEIAAHGTRSHSVRVPALT